MKKVLIGTSALVAASFVATGPAAAAEKITLGLGGFMNQWVGFADQDGSFEGTNDYGSFDAKSNTEIYFQGSTKLDNGLTVGVQVQLESDREAGSIDGNVAYISSADMGTLYLGGGYGAYSRVTANAPTAALGGATSGSQESPDQWIKNPNSTTTNANTQHATGSVSRIFFVHVDAGAEDDNGIAYVSPSFSGFQIGASYHPSTATDMDANNYKDGAVGGDMSLMQVAAKYTGNFDGVGLTVSAGYNEASDEDTAAFTDGFSQWRANGTISYAGFTFGGGYTKVDQDRASDTNDGYAWNAGLMYATGPYKISANYFTSEVRGATSIAGDDVYTYYGVNGSYTMGPGVDLKASISKVEWDDETTNLSNNNEGWFAAAGLNLAF